jgi:hypothetical protein
VIWFAFRCYTIKICIQNTSEQWSCPHRTHSLVTHTLSKAAFLRPTLPLSHYYRRVAVFLRGPAANITALAAGGNATSTAPGNIRDSKSYLARCCTPTEIQTNRSCSHVGLSPMGRGSAVGPKGRHVSSLAIQEWSWAVPRLQHFGHSVKHVVKTKFGPE